MRHTVTLIVLFLILGGNIESYGQDEKPRVIVMTDGEIDDRSSMVRFLLYTNDVDLEAIIETNSVYQREGHSEKDWLEDQIDAYEKVRPNLIKHDPDYPTADEIRDKTYVGDENPEHLVVDRNSAARRPGEDVKINPSEWADTPGSDKIVDVLLEEDPRPVYIQAWGGGNTAARAFHKLKTEYPDEYESAVSKSVMYNIWYQDGAGHYIEQNHPQVTMLLNHYFNGSWNYHSQSFTYSFIENDIKNNHGPLGNLYPQDYVSEGDTPAFLWAIQNGLRNYEDPTYGGWGGRFYKVDGFENVYADVSEGSYTRWIEDVNREFRARMDWCVADSYQDANHKPVISIDGKLDRTVSSGETVTIDAEETSDPDGDEVSFRWWQFQEAGTYDDIVDVEHISRSEISFTAPNVDRERTIHMILQVRDRGNSGLASYKRMIITVTPSS